MVERVVVITGASDGIGEALAVQLAERGASLVLVARRETELRRVAGRCGERAVPMVADVTRREEVRRVVDQAIAWFGGIDVWVNGVGRGITKLPSELTDEDIDDMMSVNVKSALYGMQEVLPHFTARNAGHVINISSVLGRVPFNVSRTAYNGAKHYLNALTAGFRSEVQQAHPGIQFTLVSPGGVKTRFGVHALHGGPDSRLQADFERVEDVAAVIAGTIESRRPDVYTQPGVHQRVVGYYSSLGSDP